MCFLIFLLTPLSVDVIHDLCRCAKIQFFSKNRIFDVCGVCTRVRKQDKAAVMGAHVAASSAVTQFIYCLL